METFSFKSYMVMNLYVPAQELQAVVEVVGIFQSEYTKLLVYFRVSLPTLDNLKIGGWLCMSHSPPPAPRI